MIENQLQRVNETAHLASDWHFSGRLYDFAARKERAGETVPSTA
ncbi:hypothetical protein X977_4865 [Burkholderia pseudomallei MSHR7504]|nr:hypothetical protein X977_4865 [Burkholderia pseudomallei MSHR7504]